MTNLNLLTAVEAARAIRKGEASAEELVQDCLDRITEVDDTVQAWIRLNADYVLEQARQNDEFHRSGVAVGSLQGVPIAVQDIFDTKDYPTQLGSPACDGRQATQDATVVAMLRQAGAIILGKTTTAEYGVGTSGAATNPQDATRTPGGLGCGSASAVGAGQVPLALASQNNGAVIQAASYCGVVGYKPSFGLASRYRMTRASGTLDQVGVIARTIDDVAMMAEVIVGYDANDSDTRLEPRPDLSAKAVEEPPMPPRFAFIKGPAWSECDESTQEAFGELCEAMGDRVEEIDLGGVYDEVFEWHRMIIEADIAKNFSDEYRDNADAMSPQLRAIIERGRKVHAVDYNLALDRVAMFGKAFEATFCEFDAIVTPSATSGAPLSSDQVSNESCATLWTFAGMPAMSLPLMQSETGLPLGVQVVAARGDDARLFRNASWLTKYVEALSDEA